MNTRQIEDRFAFDVYPRRDIVIVRGEGAKLWDDDGKEYIDCAAGIGVASVGHANRAVAEAIAVQAKRLITCPGIFYNDVRARLLQKLVNIAPAGLQRAFFCNSGTEAVEAALKAARHTTGRPKIVAMMRGYHGRTMGALAATFKKEYRDPFQPLPAEFEFVPYNNAPKLLANVDDRTAAVILEPIQGEGGVRPAKSEYLAAVRKICDQNGALMIIDEIQTGFCRTGRMFACEHHDISPDILCVAKAIAGGVPMGAIIVNDRVSSLKGIHGSTFGGNPLACAAALAAIAYMEKENLAERARASGRRFAAKFKSTNLDAVREVRQIGLMIGIELKEKVQPYIVELMKRGILALPAGPTVLRLLPPLVIDEGDLDFVVDTLNEIL